MKPFSDNIIFVDTEFSTFDSHKGEILSVGLVKLNGEELYLELEHSGKCSNWVEKNILPMLTQEKVSRVDACQKIRAFVGTTKPYMMSYVNQFDAVYMYELFGFEDERPATPFFRMPIDFASMLFALGKDPIKLSISMGNRHNLMIELGIDPKEYTKHHALDDAKLLREAYKNMLK